MVNHCSWQSNQTQITFKCHEMRYLISFLKKTHNYKQLSVASVLLTADYDGPQRAACRKIIRYPQSYSINPKNSWNALALALVLALLSLAFRRTQSQMTFVTRRMIWGFRFQMQTTIKFDFLLNFSGIICLPLNYTDRFLLEEASDIASLILITFNGKKVGSFFPVIPRAALPLLCVAFSVLKVKFLAVLAH